MTLPNLTPDAIAALFTRSDSSYFCARWGRSIVPIVFGIETETLTLFKGALEAVTNLAGHDIAETDAELGANLMTFFFRDWDELLGVPNLEKMIDGLAPLVTRLKHAKAAQYRVFRFDEEGAIRACFVFLRMGDDLAKMPATTFALTQAVQSILVWSDTAFATQSPLALLEGTAVLRPDIAGIIRAAYDPVMPAVAQDRSHALRLFARLEAAQ